MVEQNICKKTVGIAHDYVQFEETDANGVNKNIQIPIIYMNAIFKLMGKSGFCEMEHIKKYGYQSLYNQEVNVWVHDFGNFDLKPVMDGDIDIKEIKMIGELY